MGAAPSRKVVRSYRVVFRRRWRIFRIQGWRVPLPNGLELRTLGYWLYCLVAIAALGRMPLLGGLVAQAPPSLRFVALPAAGAWALSRWEIDGRSPHRALLGLAGYWLRPRVLAGLRRCPAPGTRLAPLEAITRASDPSGSSYPQGRIRGPARLLLRYPVAIALEGVPSSAGNARAERMAAARIWRLHPLGGNALHRGKMLEVPAGRVVVFDRRCLQGAEV